MKDNCNSAKIARRKYYKRKHTKKKRISKIFETDHIK